MKNAEIIYRELRDKYQAKTEKLTMIINTISNSRLIAFFAAVAFGIYFVMHKDFQKLAMDIGIFLIVFLPLVLFHDFFMKKRKYAYALYKVNKVSLMRVQGEWLEFKDIGEDFVDEGHGFSQDLDIFGEGSLFQYINAASTFLGRVHLKDLLTRSLDTAENIKARREAVYELAGKLDWRQKLQAEGRLETERMLDPSDLLDWVNERNEFYRKTPMVLLFIGIPLITIGIGVLTALATERNYYWIAAALLVQAIVVYGKFRKRAEILDTAARYTKNIKAYHVMLDHFENEPFESRHLNEMKAKLKNNTHHTAGEQIRKLVRLADMISNRNSEIYVIFNVLFLLDFHFMFALERWKSKFGVNLESWLNTVGEVEALSSLGILRFENPEWATPEIKTGEPCYRAEKMGHPLLIEKCVKNDLIFGEKDTVLLITGSNMSGKSTLLRTAGINLVLAYAGAPVCAATFQCTVMEVFACMRVHDNLEKNISSFYAELIRIKKLVEAVDAGRPLFFLLDEIFKGTNSKDRHTGARMLIKKLSQEKVLGLVSTHDLELCDLDFEIERVKNYHFQEFYKENEILFDYLLREGISKTQNAEYLMKMAGIKFDKR